MRFILRLAIRFDGNQADENQFGRLLTNLKNILQNQSGIAFGSCESIQSGELIVSLPMDNKPTVPLTIIAYNTLKKRIMDMRIRPGELLVVQPLAKNLGLSRTPVREALVRLKQEGFVEEAEGKKFRVSAITKKNVMEISEVRELMECHAVQVAAQKRTRAQLLELKKLLKRMENNFFAKDFDEFFENDLQFHSLIIHYSGNEILQEMTHQLMEKIQRIRYLTLYIDGRLDETLAEHANVVEYITRKDAEGAKRALSIHLQKVKTGVERLFSDNRINFLGQDCRGA